MIIFPNAKINLGLRVTAKRADGYHNLDTVFYPLPLFDVLEVISLGNNASDEISITISGKKVVGNIQSNLIYKAYQLLKKDYPELPSITVHLHKHIPMGAGMGGGSSDGTFMLKLLNEKFNLNITNENLAAYALQLGSDCPFFIFNKPCYAVSRGEILEPLELELSDKKWVLICPGIHVSTAAAFADIKIQEHITPSSEILKMPIHEWKQLLKNDFETTVFKQHPILEEIKEQLYQAGALYASLTGTGSTVYGLYDKEASIELSSTLMQFEHYFL